MLKKEPIVYPELFFVLHVASLPFLHYFFVLLCWFKKLLLQLCQPFPFPSISWFTFTFYFANAFDSLPEWDYCISFCEFSPRFEDFGGNLLQGCRFCLLDQAIDDQAISFKFIDNTKLNAAKLNKIIFIILKLTNAEAKIDQFKQFYVQLGRIKGELNTKKSSEFAKLTESLETLARLNVIWISYALTL